MPGIFFRHIFLQAALSPVPKEHRHLTASLAWRSPPKPTGNSNGAQANAASLPDTPDLYSMIGLKYLFDTQPTKSQGEEEEDLSLNTGVRIRF